MQQNSKCPFGKILIKCKITYPNSTIETALEQGFFVIQFMMFSKVITLLIISFLGCNSNPVSQYEYPGEDYPGEDYPGDDIYDDPSAWVDCELPKRINTFFSGKFYCALASITVPTNSFMVIVPDFLKPI